MLHQIGAGALGPVFRAYQPEPGRLVAVKLFRLDLPPDKVHQLVAELEKLVATELSHPGIAAPIGAGMAGVSAYLAQDFVAGDSLDVFARGGGSSAPADVARIAGQLGAALDCAADDDVDHGALHPRDILMSDDDIRITGFGVARALTQVGVSTPVRRPYSPPERAVGGPWDRRADMFSLAALVFELLYGRRVSGTGERAVASLPEIPGTNRPALKRFFAKALSGDPAGRFPSGAAFSDALQSALRDIPRVETALLLEPETAAPREPVADAASGPPLKARHGSRKTPRTAPATPAASLPVTPPFTPPFTPPAAPLTAPPASLPAETAGDITLSEDQLREEPAEAPMRRAEPAELDLSGMFEGSHGTSIDHASSPHDLDLMTGDVPLDVTLPSPRLRAAADQPPSHEPGVAAHDFAASALESTRSAVWPLGLALGVGIAIGFGIAMLVVGREQPTLVTQQEGASAPTVVLDEPIVPEMDPSRPAPSAAAERRDPAGTAQSPLSRSPAATPAPTAVPAPAREAVRRPEPAAALAGRVLVRSTPAGAQVFVDGKSAGVTPLTLRGVSAGVHAVRIVRDGFVTVERRVAVTEARPAATITVALARARSAAGATSAAGNRPAAPVAAPAPTTSNVGVLVVDSRPSGASVYIDGKPMGRTPLVLDDVEARSHAVTMQLAGYKPWSSTVVVAGGARMRVAASLEQ